MKNLQIPMPHAPIMYTSAQDMHPFCTAHAPTCTPLLPLYLQLPTFLVHLHAQFLTTQKSPCLCPKRTSAAASVLMLLLSCTAWPHMAVPPAAATAAVAAVVTAFIFKPPLPGASIWSKNPAHPFGPGPTPIGSSGGGTIPCMRPEDCQGAMAWAIASTSKGLGTGRAKPEV